MSQSWFGPALFLLTVLYTMYKPNDDALRASVYTHTAALRARVRALERRVGVGKKPAHRADNEVTEEAEDEAPPPPPRPPFLIRWMSAFVRTARWLLPKLCVGTGSVVLAALVVGGVVNKWPGSLDWARGTSARLRGMQ